MSYLIVNHVNTVSQGTYTYSQNCATLFIEPLGSIWVFRVGASGVGVAICSHRIWVTYVGFLEADNNTQDIHNGWRIL